MKRTVESARPLAETQGLEVRADWRLREGRWGHQKQRGEVAVLPFPVASETHGAVLTRLVFHLEAEAAWPFPPFDMIKMAINVVRIENGVADAVTFNGREHLTPEDLEATGHKRRRRRRRVIVHACGVAARRWLPESLHPWASAVLRSQADRDKHLAVNPYADVAVDGGVSRLA